MKRVTVGEILRPHGIKGSVWVKPLTDSAGRAQTLREVFIIGEDGATPARVESADVVEGRWILRFKGIGSRDAAERLRGCRIDVDPQESPPMPESSFYIHDIVGRDVFSEDGTYLGSVVDVVVTGSNDVYVIAGPEGELLFPALKELVLECAPGQRNMKVRMMPGLLEACLDREA